MTREEVRRRAEIMSAYVNGKEIEALDTAGNWVTVKNPKFYWGSIEYRIKKEPTYRPFKDKEECWAEMQKHQPFGWVKDKDNNAYLDIEMIGGDSDDCGINDVEYPRIFNEFTFADGTPFGIKDE